MDDQPRSPATIWQTAYGELQLQMPRETFDTWLRSARLIAHEDGTYIIGVRNVYAREWLEHRLKKVILRTLSQIAGRSVEVRFVVWSEQEEQDLRSAGPLLANLEPFDAPAPRFEEPDPGQTNLNPRYTFDAFATGACNRMAHAAAMAVVEDPAAQFNPLYVHAGVGMGKTHLLHAIGNAFMEWQRRVLFVTSESFTNDLVAAIRARKTGEFRDKYRDLGLLLIDDVEFMAGKDSTQEEFYHTFNALFETGAQIVAAGNGAPGAIRRLDPRLASRFDGGLVVEILPPDFATRIEILRTKARQRGFEGRIPVDVLEVIAGQVEGSVRELEGAFNRLVAASLLGHEAPSAQLAETAVGEARASKKPLSLADVLFAVAESYEIDVEELTGRGRSREVSNARQVAMYIAYKETDASLQQIGDVLGGRNHSTVLYSCERVEDLMNTDSAARREITNILHTLRPERVGRE